MCVQVPVSPAGNGQCGAVSLLGLRPVRCTRVTMCLCVVSGEESEGRKHSDPPAETALHLPVRLGSHPHSPAAISAFPTAARVPPEVTITGWGWGGGDQMWHAFLKGSVPVTLP